MMSSDNYWISAGFTDYAFGIVHSGATVICRWRHNLVKETCIYPEKIPSTKDHPACTRAGKLKEILQHYSDNSQGTSDSSILS